MSKFRMQQHVRHQRRPEWGVGVIESAKETPANGKEGWRLVVRFENAGRKTLHTSVADIVDASNWTATAGMARPRPDNVNLDDTSFGEYISITDDTRNENALENLPESVNDPFSTPGQRLKATLELYRFERNPRGLMEWAIAQTGMKDPLELWPRHTLEIGFDRFRKNLDQHLFLMIRELRKNKDIETLKVIQKIKLPKDAIPVLKKIAQKK